MIRNFSWKLKVIPRHSLTRCPTIQTEKKFEFVIKIYCGWLCVHNITCPMCVLLYNGSRGLVEMLLESMMKMKFDDELRRRRRRKHNFVLQVVTRLRFHMKDGPSR